MHAVKEDDYELMRAIAGERDQRAFAALYDRHSGLVFTLCLRVLHDKAEAEDLLVDVFYEVWEKADRYDPSRGSPTTYLSTLARSRAIDRLRSKSSRSAGPAMTLVRDDEPAPTADPSQQTADAERRKIVSSALDQLDPAQRQAIESAYYDGLSHSEIAAKLNKPLGTVKTWIRQGLIRLRDSLRSQYEETTTS